MKQRNKSAEADKRRVWQERLDKARNAYQAMRDRMELRNSLYEGSHATTGPGGVAGKNSSNVRNIVYELIESQVDSTVPAPKVTAIHQEDQELAKKIEALLLNETRRLHLKVMNDLQERTVPIQGGDFWHVEWDPNAGFHCNLGDLTVTERHPRQIIPQPGVEEIENMDYVFVLMSQTRKSLKRRYNVDVEETTEEDRPARGNDDGPVDDLVTQAIAYYRNDEGGIGVFSWVGDQTLEDLEDYQSRRTEVCAECGAKKTGAECACGSRSFKKVPDEWQSLTEDIVLGSETIPATAPGPDELVMNPDGSPQVDIVTGEPIVQPGAPVATQIPYYKPNCYPVILRRNVRKSGQLLGVSDVDVVQDQQNAINKYGTKIEEKLLKGGSYVTLPQGVNIETTDRELKVIRLKNPADKALIGVINVQPDTSRDQQMVEVNYTWAKSTLGITDAFQGKYDASATSGTAKQFSANQSAGRLQSKREMKNETYAQLYKRMFQFMLAYSDQRYPLTTKQPDGEQTFGHFDRYEFLKRDVAGEFYWNDEFIFEVDTASNLASNRETLWNMIDVKYQAGAFGPINDTASQYRLWTLLAETGYPHAETMRESIKQQMEKNQQAMEAQAGAVPQEPAQEPMQGAGVASGAPT